MIPTTKSLTLAIDLVLALAQSGRLEAFVTFIAIEACSLVPGEAAAHHLLGHVDGLLAARTDISSAKLWPSIGVGHDGRRFGCHICLGGGRNIRVGSILLAIEHRNGRGAIPKTLRSKQTAIALLAIDLLVMFGQTARIETTLARLVS